MDYKKRLEVRVEAIEAQIRYLARLPFSNDWREACAERAVAGDLEDELAEKLRLLDEFFPNREEDPAYWDRLTGRLY